MDAERMRIRRFFYRKEQIKSRLIDLNYLVSIKSRFIKKNLARTVDSE